MIRTPYDTQITRLRGFIAATQAAAKLAQSSAEQAEGAERAIAIAVELAHLEARRDTYLRFAREGANQ